MPLIIGLGDKFDLQDPLGLYKDRAFGLEAPQQKAAPPVKAPVADASLPAGMRNNNPGNIKYRQDVPWNGMVGPSENTDQGDPQAVFETPELGMRAAYKLARNKYDRGQKTAIDIIAGEGGWTPGNVQAAQNIARTMGIAPDEDLRLDDPGRATKFLRALVTQEHGQAAQAYTDDMIAGTVDRTSTEMNGRPGGSLTGFGGPSQGLPATATPGQVARGSDGRTYQYAETRGMDGATGDFGWILYNGGSGGAAGALERLAGGSAAAEENKRQSAAKTDWLAYANQGAIRNQHLNTKLVNALSFLPDMGVTMQVFSGGQDATGSRRTGSHRHDHGNAADVFFYKDGRQLSWQNPQDIPIFQQIVERAKANGVTGFGAGDGYMRPGSMHIGFGTPAVWGAGNSGSNAPDWLRTAFASEGPASSSKTELQRGSIVADSSFKPADPFGLYSGADNPLMPKPADLRPFNPGERRDNSDGTYSTEISTTWQLPDGKWVNVPSLWMGPDGPKQFDAGDEDGILGAMQRWEAKSGKPFPRFDSEQQAVDAAKARSAAGGAAAGLPASPSPVEQIFQGLNAKEPGRYKLINADQMQNWRADWEKNQSGQFMKGLKGALVDQNPELAGNALEAVSVLTDQPTLKDWGDTVRQWGQKNSYKRIPRVGSVSDIRTDGVRNFLSDALDYAAYSLGQGIGSMAPGLALGVGTAAVTANPVAGFIAGESGPSYIQNLGDIYGSLRDDPEIAKRVASGELSQKQVATWAAAAAVPMAALDTFSAGKAIDIAGGDKVKSAVVKRIVKGLVEGSLTEGGTEGLQEVISQSVQAALGSDKPLADRAISVADNAIGGALAGGAIGGASHVRGGHADVDEAPAPLPEEQAPPVPVQAAPATPQPSGPISKALLEGQRRAAAARGIDVGQPASSTTFVVDDGPIDGSPAGELDGQTVTLAPDQSKVPTNMRRVVTQDGSERIVGNQLLVQRPAALADAPAAAPAAPNLPPPHEIADRPVAETAGGAFQKGTTVRVDADGIPPFMATVENIEGDEAVVFDSSSGEIYQIPTTSLTPIAAPPGQASVAAAPSGTPAEVGNVPTPAPPTTPTVITRGMRDRLGQLGYDNKAIREMTPETASNILRAADQGFTPDANDAALEPAARAAAETKSELPPAAEEKPAAEAFPGPPAPGQRVIVNQPGVDRFAARVERYEDVDGRTEAVVVNDEGSSLQVPLEALKVSAKTKNEVEADELKRNPPVPREPAPKNAGTDRAVAGHTVTMPDERHARLFDLGKLRLESKMTLGASKLDMDSVSPAAQQHIADDFGISFAAAGQMADDYRYRVERAGKQARSQLPVKMHGVNETRLKQWQNEVRKAAGAEPSADGADWWHGELTEVGRRQALEMAGVKRSAKTSWRHLPKSIQDKLLAARDEMHKMHIPADEVPDAGNMIDTAAHEAATSPRNDLPEPSQAQKEAGNYKLGHLNIAGLDISIENPEGSTRSGVSANGRAWSNTMKSHYGYIRGTVGRDKDHVDVFVNPRRVTAQSGTSPVYVVDQNNAKGAFDEHKVMLGYGSAVEARQAYLENFTKGWKGLGTLNETTLDDFKRWLNEGDTRRPFAERETEPAEIGHRESEDEVLNRMAERHSVKNFIEMLAVSPNKQIAAVIDRKGRIWEITGNSSLDLNPNAGGHGHLFAELREAGLFDDIGLMTGIPYAQITRYGHQMGLGYTSSVQPTEQQIVGLRALKAAAQRNGISVITDDNAAVMLAPRATDHASESVGNTREEKAESQKSGKPESQRPKRAAAEELSAKGRIAAGIIGTAAGGLVKPSADIEYSRAGETYRVERVERSGTVHIVNMDRGARTTWSFASILRARNQGVEFTNPAEPVVELPSPVDKPAEKSAPVAEPTALPVVDNKKEWGASNTLVTRDRAEEVRKRLREKLRGQLSSGIDPEILAMGAELAAFHIEAGARRFADFARAVAQDLGTTTEKLRPFLRAWYNGARDMLEDTGHDIAGTDDADVVRTALAALSEEQGREPSELDRPGEKPLEGAPAEALRGAEGGRNARKEPARSGQPDLFGGEPARGRRDPAGRGVADGAGKLPDAAGRGPEPGAAAEPVAQAGAGSDVRTQDGGDRVTYPKSAAATPSAKRAVDYTLSDADELGAGGEKAKFRNNVAAIELLRRLEAENRPATRDEQSVLAKWVGWGGLRNAFPREDGTVAKGWEREATALQDLLTPEEFKAAAASTRNAHYTSPEVVRAIWDIARRLGFAGGQVLEPSVGAGNFIGLMPGQWRDAAAVTGVELDHITGGIARNLYPHANITAPVGFQDFVVPDGHFDLAIGNPPFGSERLYDADRRQLNKFSIHNFFFAKSIDALKPKGVLAMVVTNYFLDAADARARAYIAARADLLGAIRLPNNAFLKNAGTEVTTDIIVLQKRAEGTPAADLSWVDVADFKDKEGRVVPLNRYFKKHPEMMLGDFGAYGTMYGREGHGALVARDDDDLPSLLRSATLALPEAVMERPGAPVIAESVVVPSEAGEAQVGSMFLGSDGSVFQRKPDMLGKPQADAVTFPNETARERVSGMVRVRDAFARLRRAQIDDRATDEQIDNLRRRLNDVYDAFVRRHGPINHDVNRRLFRDDPTWPQISALEDGFDKGVSAAVAKTTGETARPPSARKAAIFTKRTQQPYHRPTSASSAKDALATVLGDLGRVDLDAMVRLYGKAPEQIIDELGPLVYRTPSGAYETADQYLAGNVKAKIAEAQRAAEQDPQFRRNVAALQDVIPADIEPVDIDVKPGAPWLPPDHVAAFADHIAEAAGAAAFYSRANAKWALQTPPRWAPSPAADAQWSTDRTSVAGILDAVLNGQTVSVYDRTSDGKTVLNQPATDAANEKAAKVKAEWQRWIWDDDARREQLARLYNDTFNTDVLRRYDGAHLTLPGKIGDDIITLRPHQKNFIWRTLQSPTALADHVVGAGKTFAVIASMMEKRRIGQARKPVLTVPNHLVGQWAADFVKLYPGAKVLATTKKDFEAENRKRLFARIATGDWDAVIIAHSSFGRIGISPEFEQKFIEEQIADLETSMKELREATGEKSRNVAQLAKWRENLQSKLKRLLDAGAKDAGLSFDELGIDAIYVDEAHEFKNLAFATSQQRVAGLGNPTGSQKAADLYMKIKYVEGVTGGHNIVFATGTPLSNTMAEMYTMQRYLDGQALKDLGISHFDAWARVFGEIVTDWELSPSGQYKLKSRFAKFTNLPELMQRYLSFADVITNDDIKAQLAAIGKKLPLPKVKGGKPQNVVVERSPDQAAYIGVGTPDSDGNLQFPAGSLVWRAEHLPKKAEKGADNMLKVMSDARKAALDMRLIDPAYPDHPGSKVHIAADRMKAIYDRWTAKKGTQLVFIDLSTPKKAKAKEQARILDLMKRASEGDEAAMEAVDNMSPDEFLALDSTFSVYDDLRQKLLDRGVPAAEIAFVHDANTDPQKEELFGKVRAGRVRFLFGSTPKMGAGTNVQNRLVALHHLDAPWRPSDLEQRDGRAIRQGNELYAEDPDGFEIEINRYATKNTLDARQWQTIEGKARFIQQVRKGGITSREIEDIAGEAANAAEMKAAASGNPLILEEMDLRQKLRRLESQRSEHEREQHRIRGRIRSMQDEERRNLDNLPAAEQDAAAARALSGEEFAATVAGKTVEKPSDMGAEILGAARNALKTHSEGGPLGSYGPFKLALEYSHTRAFIVTIDGAAEHTVFIEDVDGAAPAGVGMRVVNSVRRLMDVPAELRSRNEEIGQQVPALERQVQPWPQEEQLRQTTARHQEVLAELKPKPAATTTAPPTAEPSIPEDQSRQHGIPAAAIVISSYANDRPLKAHVDYKAAKAGDTQAAVRLVRDVVKPGTIEAARKSFGTDVIFTPVVALEASGHNAIPWTLAEFFAANAGARTTIDIVQANRAFHTGAGAMERIFNRALFSGPVEAGAKYVLVDDVTVMGSTLAELANHIRAAGGDVAGVVTLVNASRVDDIAAKPKQTREIERRFGDVVRQDLGLEPASLTASEAGYILNFRDADALRNRIASSGVERGRRLGAKGISAPETGGAESSLIPSGWDVADGLDVQQLSEADRQEIRDIVRKVSGLDDVTFTRRIELPNGAPGWGTNAPTTAGGFYDPAADAITIALDSGSGHVAYHEAFHRLQRLFLSSQEKAVLAAEKGRLRSMVAGRMGREAQASRMSQKELEAEAFAIYSAGTGKIKPHVVLRAAWDRIAKMVRRVRNFLAGRGFQTSENVFDRAAAGEVRERPSQQATKINKQYSIAPAASRVLTENRAIEEVKGKLTDLQPNVLAAVPLNYFPELARPNMTAVAEYLRVKRLLDAYRGKKHAAADEIAQRWLKFARLGFGKDGKARAAKLADLMHEATLAGIDPSKTDEETSSKPGYNELRAEYMALPPTGRELFANVRDAYKAQAAELDRILLDNVRKAQEIAQRQAEKQFRDELDRIAAAKLSPQAKEDARNEAEQAYKAQATKAQWSMKARLTKMRIAFEASRVEEPYFPLARFGRYFVTVRDVDGTVLSFSRRERAADRDRLAAELRKAYPGRTVEVGVTENGADIRQAMDPRIIAEIETIIGGAGLDSSTMTTVLDQIWQRYLSTMPDLSTRKRFIHRKGTAGFDADALRAFSSHMFHAAHQMGRLKYGLEMQELVSNAADQARESDDVTRGMTLANELKARHKWVMNPTGSSVAQIMTSAAFVWYLAGSASAALVNVSQTPMLGIPILAGRFGGFTKAAAAIGKAAIDTVTGRGSVVGANLTEDERKAVEAFYETGLVDRTQSHDIAGVGETGVDYSPLKARVMSILSWAFHRTEVWNREVTALAAYRLARDAGQNTMDAIDTAHDLTWKTHFDYSNASRPRLMQNDLAKVALVFRSYNVNMLYRLFRDVHQSFKGETAQARREARYQLGGIMGMMSLLAGVTGAAGFNIAMAIAGALLGDDDDPLDFEQQFRKGVIDYLGPELGGVVLNGLPGHYLGIDLTSRIGMPDLWFRSPYRDLQGKDEFDYWVMSQFGATVSLAGDMYRGYDLIRQGDTAKGIEAIAPKWARDLMKSYRYANEGVTNARGDSVVDASDIDAWDLIAQAAGFTPAKVAETYDRNSALINAESRMQKRRQQAVNAYALAARMGDEDGKAGALEAIKAFNRSPFGKTMPVTAETLRNSLRARQRNAAKKEDGVLIENQQLGKRLREALPERVYR